MDDKSAAMYRNSAAQAPKIAQAEFPAVEERPGHSDSIEVATTPPKLSTSQFGEGDMNMLPTPLVYTPCSPGSAVRSPMEQKFPSTPSSATARAKKGYGGLMPIGAELLNRSHILEDRQRILSEYAPHSALVPATASSLSQRVSSLSGVELKLDAIHEYAPASQSSLTAADPAQSDSEDVLTGYSVNDTSAPLYWRKVKQIGVGNFSDVYLYEVTEQNATMPQKVAVKRVKYPEALTLSASPKSPRFREVLSRVENSLTRELEALLCVSHPCIIQFLAINDPTFLNNKRPLSSRDLSRGLPPCDMVMSYCAGGDLFELASQNTLPDWLLRRIFTELTLAVKYLHENLIVHRDLKLENVLIKYPLDDILAMREQPELLHNHHLVELADFGLCRRIEPEEMCTTRCGSEDYVSPEILMGVPYDGRLSDSWAMGVILYALLEDRLPFDPLPSAAPGKRQRRSSTAHRISRFEWRWIKMSESDSPAKEIVGNCLTRKNLRYSIQEIYKNPYVHELVPTLRFAS